MSTACENCKWWKKGIYQDLGVCYGWPPTVDKGLPPRAVFGSTKSKDFCRNFENRNDK